MGHVLVPVTAMDWAFKLTANGPPRLSKTIAIFPETPLPDIKSNFYKQAAKLVGLLVPEVEYPDALGFQQLQLSGASSSSEELLDVDYLLAKLVSIITEPEPYPLRPEFENVVDFKSATISLLVMVDPIYAGRVHKNPAMAGIGASLTPQLQQVSVGQGSGSGKGSRATQDQQSQRKRAAADPDKALYKELLLKLLPRQKEVFDGLVARSAAAATQKAAQVQAARDACVGHEPAVAAARNAVTEFRRQLRASADKDRPFFFQRKDLASQDRRAERLLQGMMTQVAVQRFNTSKKRQHLDNLSYATGEAWVNEWVGIPCMGSHSGQRRHLHLRTQQLEQKAV